MYGNDPVSDNCTNSSPFLSLLQMTLIMPTSHFSVSPTNPCSAWWASFSPGLPWREDLKVLCAPSTKHLRSQSSHFLSYLSGTLPCPSHLFEGLREPPGSDGSSAPGSLTSFLLAGHHGDRPEAPKQVPRGKAGSHRTGHQQGRLALLHARHRGLVPIRVLRGRVQAALRE